MGYFETVSAIEQAPRRYAKRQQTWFRTDSAIEWIDVSALNSATVASRILSRLEKEKKRTKVRDHAPTRRPSICFPYNLDREVCIREQTAT